MSSLARLASGALVFAAGKLGLYPSCCCECKNHRCGFGGTPCREGCCCGPNCDGISRCTKPAKCDCKSSLKPEMELGVGWDLVIDPPFVVPAGCDFNSVGVGGFWDQCICKYIISASACALYRCVKLDPDENCLPPAGQITWDYSVDIPELGNCAQEQTVTVIHL